MEKKKKSIGRFFLMSLLFCLIMTVTAGQSRAGREKKDQDREWRHPHKETSKWQGRGYRWDRHWAHMGPVRMFNLWVADFMIHRELLDLTPEQKDKIENLNAEHQKAAIRAWADIGTEMVDLKRLFNTENLDLQAIETQLKKIANRDIKAIMEGLKFYTDLMNTLTTQQKERVKEIIGSPFVPPWQEQSYESRPKKFSRPKNLTPAPEKGGNGTGPRKNTEEK